MPRCTARPPATGCGLGDTDLVIEVEHDLATYGEEVKFGGGKVIRDGMGQSRSRVPEGPPTPSSPMRSSSIMRASGRPTWGCATAASPGIGKAGNPDTQAGVSIVIGPGTEIIAGRGAHPDRRRLRRAYPFHLPAADRRSAPFRHHHDARRRHRPRARHARHDLPRRPVAPRADAAGRSTGCRSTSGSRARATPRAPKRSSMVEGGALRAEAPRGLGHHPPPRSTAA